MYALNLNEEKRILSATFEEYASEDMVKVETLPDGNLSDYKYIDGEFVYDPLPHEPEVKPEPTADEVLDVLLGIGGEV